MIFMKNKTKYTLMTPQLAPTAIHPMLQWKVSAVWKGLGHRQDFVLPYNKVLSPGAHPSHVALFLHSISITGAFRCSRCGPFALQSPGLLTQWEDEEPRHLSAIYNSSAPVPLMT